MIEATVATTNDRADYAPLASPRRDTGPPVAGSDTASSAATILSSMASLLGLQVADTFLCQICLDSQALVSQSHVLSACGHRFCSSCITSYIAFHVQAGETDIQCFYQETDDTACLTSIPLVEIDELVDAQTFAKLQRFLFHKTHANARQCPYCDHTQLCGSATTTIAQCEACGRAFCTVHGNAHPNESCHAYSKRTRRDEKRNLAVVHRLCRACPGCGQLVEKDGGCNQVRCWACKTSFCWLCRKVLTSTTYSTHYQWWNSGGCTGSQVADTDDGTKSDCEKRVLAFFRGLFMVVLGPPALVLAVVCSVIGCCCYPCTKLYNVSYRQAFMTCVCVCGYVLLLPLLLPGVLLFLPCVLIAYWASPQSFAEVWHDSMRDRRNPRSREATRVIEGEDSPV